VVIPAGRPQSIENSGSTDLGFYCICNPRLAPERYSAREEQEK